MGTRPADQSWLTAAQAAARLGVKPATLYAYVSRGLIPRRRGADGRTSLFSASDVQRLAKRTPHSRAAPTDIVVPTTVSFLDGTDGRLWYRGVDATEAASKHSFEDVAEFLWTGRWQPPGRWPGTWKADPDCLRAAERAQRALPKATPVLDRVPVALAAARAADRHRTDLGPDGVVRTARNLLSTLVASLPPLGPRAGERFAERLWPLLTADEPTSAGIELLDETLGLNADRGITRSVVAGRLAASLGGDPYAVVGSAIGVATAEPLVAREREPGSSALTEGSGSFIATIARIAGWIAHAMDEYRRPTPFRAHATYVGTLPFPEQRREANLLHAVQNYLRES